MILQHFAFFRVPITDSGVGKYCVGPVGASAVVTGVGLGLGLLSKADVPTSRVVYTTPLI